MKIEPYPGWKIIKGIDGHTYHVPTNDWLQEAEEKYQLALKDNKILFVITGGIIGILATLLLRCVL